MKLILIIYITLLISNGTYSQCDYTNNTFKSAEHIEYNVYYNLGFMWFNAAEVNFNVNTISHNNQKAFYFTSFGQTLPNYDWIFKVRDSYESIADLTSLKPIKFSKNTNEGKHHANNSYTFNYNDSLIYSTINNSDTIMYNDTLNMQKCTFDVLTAVYAFRNIKYSTVSLYDTIPINMLIENKVYSLYLRYLGIDNAENDNNIIYRCRKFKILMVEGTIFSGNEDITVWISDDRAKIPIKVEAKILIGSIIAKVRSIKGNKWQLNSIITK